MDYSTRCLPVRKLGLTLLMCLVALFAHGQAVTTGTVVGTITDPSGAAVPGVTITLTDAATSAIRTTVTGASGQYVLVNIPPGTYSITASKTGFSTSKVSTLAVSLGTQTTANIKLQVGGGQTTIEVVATGADLQTLNSTIGATIGADAVASLPSINHDVNTFAEMQPGVSPDGSVAGTVVDQSTFILDGGNNTNDMDGSMNVYTPSFADDLTGGLAGGGGPTGVLPTPQDSVDEVKVNTTNQTADFNSSAGAQVEIVTRRGRNQFHGSAYEYYFDNNFNANTWDNNLTGTRRPSFHYSKFGASLGGPMGPWNVLGGKTYFFGMYQGYRFPKTATYEAAVPSDAMRQGLVTFGGTQYDLNLMDPREIGINPVVQQMWTKYEPEGNDPTCGGLHGARCDGVNEIGFKGSIAIPQSDNFWVGRIDHDFGARWHWMASYRYYKLTRTTTNQVDIGGFFKGDKLGVPTSQASRPQQPWYLVSGLTTNISSTTTNDFHYSFLRDYWSWSDAGAPPQISGLGGVLEPFGEYSTTVMAPFNVNTQSIRTRFWDGHDHYLRDDVSMLKGNHLLQFGAQYQHNWNYHQRTDNGGGINYTTTYQLGDSSGSGLVDLAELTDQGYPTGSKAARVAAAVLGIVTDSQTAYTRTGSNLTLNPPLTPASDKSTVPYYNFYFSDTWHMKPAFTLTYGLSYALEMPPIEESGKQVALVDASDALIKVEDYLAQRKSNALKGQPYNPELGYALVGNVGSGLKYPYNPFYGAFSPRLSAAWNPKFSSGTVLSHIFGENSTVLRGGYGRVFGRLNGVDLVLVPLLGTGLIQPVQCRLALSSGACGPETPTVSTAFRIGVDGNTAPLAQATQTLPQPLYPGFNNVSAAAGEVLDPAFRPNDVDSFDLTLQRQLNNKMILEVGYIGRLIHHEYQPINLNAVPYMMSAGGQQFQAAYAAVEQAMGCATSAAGCGQAGVPTVAPQAFFETALAGTGYCAGYANCTDAVVNQEFNNFATQSVWSLWSDLDNGGFNFSRTMTNTPIPSSQSAYGSNGQISSGVASNASVGYGNYNGGFISFRTLGWHGLTTQHNITWSKALGTGAFVQASSEYTPNDPWDLHKMYGEQGFDRRIIYNSYFVYDTPWYKGQAGLVGRALGGWEISPVFVAGTGAPVYCNTQTDAQAFGSGDGANFFDNEQCLFTVHYGGGHSTHGNGITGVNFFSDPTAVANSVRAPILGIDNANPGVGPIMGLPYWNLSMGLKKTIVIHERAQLELQAIIQNALNHDVLSDPYLDISALDQWGTISSQGNTPRQIELGGHFTF